MYCRLLTLRKTLSNFLTHSPATDAIYRRWRWQCAQQVPAYIDSMKTIIRKIAEFSIRPRPHRG